MSIERVYKWEKNLIRKVLEKTREESNDYHGGMLMIGNVELTRQEKKMAEERLNRARTINYVIEEEVALCETVSKRIVNKIKK